MPNSPIPAAKHRYYSKRFPTYQMFNIYKKLLMRSRPGPEEQAVTDKKRGRVFIQSGKQAACFTVNSYCFTVNSYIWTVFPLHVLRGIAFTQSEERVFGPDEETQ